MVYWVCDSESRQYPNEMIKKEYVSVSKHTKQNEMDIDSKSCANNARPYQASRGKEIPGI